MRGLARSICLKTQQNEQQVMHRFQLLCSAVLSESACTIVCLYNCRRPLAFRFKEVPRGCCLPRSETTPSVPARYLCPDSARWLRSGPRCILRRMSCHSNPSLSYLLDVLLCCLRSEVLFQHLAAPQVILRFVSRASLTGIPLSEAHARLVYSLGCFATRGPDSRCITACNRVP